METYADKLRELAKMLDDDFDLNLPEVISALLGLVTQLYRDTLKREA